MLVCLFVCLLISLLFVAFVYVCVSSLFWILFFSLIAQKELIVSREWFRSTALRVMSPPRFPCATLLSTLSLSPLSLFAVAAPFFVAALFYNTATVCVHKCHFFPLAYRLTLSPGKKDEGSHVVTWINQNEQGKMSFIQRKLNFFSFLFLFSINRREENKNIGYGHTKRKAPLLARSVKLSLFGLG